VLLYPYNIKVEFGSMYECYDISYPHPMEESMRALAFPRAMKIYNTMKNRLGREDPFCQVQGERLAFRGLKRKLASEIVAKVESYSMRVQLASQLRSALAEDIYAYTTPAGTFPTESNVTFDYD
jgi:hypothetical protein